MIRRLKGAQRQNSNFEWKLCAPVKKLGVNRPFAESAAPSVPPRIGVGFGVMPMLSIASNIRSMARRSSPMALLMLL
jgi:hypothetical protein